MPSIPDVSKSHYKLSGLEVGLFLALGNLSSLANWLLGVPVNVGGTGILLAAFIFWYVWRRNRASQLAAQHSTYLEKATFGWDKLLIALGAGLAITLPPMLFFLFPVVVGDLGYNPIKDISLSELLYRTLLSVPLFTAIPEELLFRSYLYKPRATNRGLGGEESKQLAVHNKQSKNANRQSLVFNIIIFTLWHLVVVARTVLDTNLSDNIFLGLLSYTGALAAVAVGAAVFWLVRWKTGSFWYAALTHWLNVALMNWVIWLS
jgi:membrane protease YdiL (CAAX protease family)